MVAVPKGHHNPTGLQIPSQASVSPSVSPPGNIFKKIRTTIWTDQNTGVEIAFSVPHSLQISPLPHLLSYPNLSSIKRFPDKAKLASETSPPLRLKVTPVAFKIPALGPPYNSLSSHTLFPAPPSYTGLSKSVPPTFIISEGQDAHKGPALSW